MSQRFFKELEQHAPMSIWARQFGLGVFFEGDKGRRVDLGGIGSKYDWGTLYDIAK